MDTIYKIGTTDGGQLLIRMHPQLFAQLQAISGMAGTDQASLSRLRDLWVTSQAAQDEAAAGITALQAFQAVMQGGA